MADLRVVCLFVSSLTLVLGTRTFYMDQLCSQTLDMTAEGIESGILKLTADYEYANNMDCTLTIKAPVGNMLIFNNPTLDLEYTNDVLRLFDGRTGSYMLLETYTGSSHNRYNKKTTQRYAMLHFTSDSNIEYDGFTMVFTAFTDSYCSSTTGYSCTYGVCIDSSLKCDGTRNCDADINIDELFCDSYDYDYTGLSTAAIAGISTASVGLFIAFVALIIFCNRRRTNPGQTINHGRTNATAIQTITTTYSVQQGSQPSMQQNPVHQQYGPPPPYVQPQYVSLPTQQQSSKEVQNTGQPLFVSTASPPQPGFTT